MVLKQFSVVKKRTKIRFCGGWKTLILHLACLTKLQEVCDIWITLGSVQAAFINHQRKPLSFQKYFNATSPLEGIQDRRAGRPV